MISLQSRNFINLRNNLMPKRTTLFIFFCLIPTFLFSAGHQDFNGSWELVPQKSTVIPFYRTLVIEFKIDDNGLTLIQKWSTRSRDAFADSVRLSTDGKKTLVPLQHQVAPTNVFLRIKNLTGAQREMSASLILTCGGVGNTPQAVKIKGKMRCRN